VGEQVPRGEEPDEDAPPSNGAGAAAPHGALPPLISHAAKLEFARGLPAAFTSGLPGVDRQLGGGLRGESIYPLVAPVGRGKSALATKISLHVGLTRDVLYVTTELSVRQVLARFAAHRLGEPWLRLWESGRSADGRPVSVVLEGRRVRVVKYRPGVDFLHMASLLALDASAPPLLVVDYIQHVVRQDEIAQAQNAAERRIAVGMASEVIRQWCEDQRATAILVSSTARERGGGQAGDKGRSARDFENSAKESGDVDYDAAAILYLDTDEGCGRDGGTAARLHIAKSRYSQGGTVGLRFYGATGAFVGDEGAVLTVDQRRAYEAIESGAPSVEAVRAALAIGKAQADKIVAALAARGLVDRDPLRVRKQP
jgi:hypothetical protein